MAFKISGRIEGLEPMLARLRQLEKKSAQMRVLRAALTKGSKPVLDTAKKLAPVSGPEDAPLQPRLLRKSLGRRVKTYGGRSTVVVIIGPRSKPSFRRQVGTRTRGKQKGQPVIQNPTKYAHLVEFGTRRSRAFPFLRPAFDLRKREAQAIIGREIFLGILRELAKAKGKK